MLFGILVNTRRKKMKLSEAIKPISYLKAHASEILRDISSNRKTMVITQNGEAKAILQDIQVYEQMQESLALLRILAMSNRHRKDGKYKTIEQSFHDIKKRIKEDNQNEVKYFSLLMPKRTYLKYITIS